MALTRKGVLAIINDEGLTPEEKVAQIIDGHLNTVNGLKDDVAKYKGDAEKLPNVQKELDDLKAAGDGGWKDKHDTVKKEFDDYKAEQTKKDTRAAKEKAFREVLKEASISEKRFDVIIKATDLDALELAEDGKFKDAKKVTDNVKQEWADFVVTTTTTGADTKNPPANNPSGPMKREDIYKKDEKGRYLLDAAARQKALAETMNNPE